MAENLKLRWSKQGNVFDEKNEKVGEVWGEGKNQWFARSPLFENNRAEGPLRTRNLAREWMTKLVKLHREVDRKRFPHKVGDVYYSDKKVMHSAAGYYIGTSCWSIDPKFGGMEEPGSRESDYFPDEEAAKKALYAGFEVRGADENDLGYKEGLPHPATNGTGVRAPAELMGSPDGLDREVVAQLRERGGTWAVYENHAMDSADLGRLVALKYGPGCTFTSPPAKAPDSPEWGTGWKYQHVGFFNPKTGLIQAEEFHGGDATAAPQ